MKQFILIGFALLFIISCSEQQKSLDENTNLENEVEKRDYTTVEFLSSDSLLVTGNLYYVNDAAPFILLCHQARFNKFEYEGVAQRLNKTGFNCLAIDQRSGGPIANYQNETYLRAVEKGLSIDYIDAEPDMLAGIEYIKETFGKSCIIWGSSYSSTLALYIGLENDNVDAVVSFSPGNYLTPYKGSLVDKLEHFNKPFFVTSSVKEVPRINRLFEKCELQENQVIFAPEGVGHHGSRALWINQLEGEKYWKAVTAFLERL